jgi:hypothetical protein
MSIDPAIKSQKILCSPFKLAEHASNCSFLLVQISTFISKGCIRYPRMPKFMQSLGEDNYHRLLAEAKARDVTVQALIRTIVVPDWLKAVPTGQAKIQNTLAQPTSLLARTGILTEQARRPFLNTSLGRART